MRLIETVMLLMTGVTALLCIASVILGYNINASKKIFTLPKKIKPTEDEIMMERIENAQVYKTEI